MRKITIISSSIRTGRSSHRVALFFKQFIEENKLGSAEILDLAEYDFPIFSERLTFQSAPLPSAIEFSEKITLSNGVIIVTPEYNGGYPASLKNVIDLLTVEWKRKPVAISTVSSGNFGGSQVLTSLQFTLWKIGALTVPAMFPVPNVNQAFDEKGIPKDFEKINERVKIFIDELFYHID